MFIEIELLTLSVGVMVGIQWVGRDEELAYADYLCGASFWRVIDTIGLHDTNLTQKEAEDSVAPCGTYSRKSSLP